MSELTNNMKKSFLKELEQTFLGETSPLPDAKSLLEELVASACKSDLDYYEEVIEAWARNTGEKALGSCIAAICDPGNGIFHKYDNVVEKACENWFQNNRIGETVEGTLHEKFRQMFPAFTGTLSYLVKMPDMSDMPGKELDNSFKINPYMFFDEANCPEDPYDTNRPFTSDQRGQILQVYRSHRKALAEGGQYSVKGNPVKIKGIKSIYAEQLTLADAQRYRDAIVKKLMAAVEGFVESLTVSAQV